MNNYLYYEILYEILQDIDKEGPDAELLNILNDVVLLLMEESNLISIIDGNIIVIIPYLEELYKKTQPINKGNNWFFHNFSICLKLAIQRKIDVYNSSVEKSDHIDSEKSSHEIAANISNSFLKDIADNQ